MVRQERNLSEGECAGTRRALRGAGGAEEDDEEDDFYPTQAGKTAKKKLRADRWRQQDRLLARTIKEKKGAHNQRERWTDNFFLYSLFIHPRTKNQE